MEDLSEKEQLEQMRAWWSEYGNYVVGGIVVGIAIMVGLSQYRSKTELTQTEASTLYETVFESVADGKLEDAEVAAARLFADYATTVYPSQARLAMARLYMDKGRDLDAANALRTVVDQQGDTEIGLIARLRLAKVLLYQDKAQEVVDLLSKQPENSFTARFSEALGDAHVALGDHADARDAYLVALAGSSVRPTVDRVLVQMKIDDLPEISVIDASDSEALEEPVVNETADEQAESSEGGAGEFE